MWCTSAYTYLPPYRCMGPVLSSSRNTGHSRRNRAKTASRAGIKVQGYNFHSQLRCYSPLKGFLYQQQLLIMMHAVYSDKLHGMLSESGLKRSVREGHSSEV